MLLSGKKDRDSFLVLENIEQISLVDYPLRKEVYHGKNFDVKRKGFGHFIKAFQFVFT